MTTKQRGLSLAISRAEKARARWASRKLALLGSGDAAAILHASDRAEVWRLRAQTLRDRLGASRTEREEWAAAAAPWAADWAAARVAEAEGEE